jgi:hypothetical protein
MLKLASVFVYALVIAQNGHCRVLFVIIYHIQTPNCMLTVLQVRSDVIAAWARHLAEAWRDKPYSHLVQVSEANLHVYDCMTGIPHAVVAAACTVEDEQEASDLQ